MKNWKTYHYDVSNEKFGSIIIGFGIGGLCAVALLGIKGKRLLVLEKHFKIGGWTHTFKRKDYEWDVGIHYTGQVHKPTSPIRKLFDIISDGQLQWSHIDNKHDNDKAVQNYIDNPKSDFPVVYVSFSSAKDDKWIEKHSNKATIEAITLSRMSWYEKCEHLDREKRGSDFEEDKKRLSKCILDVIAKHNGGLKGNIDHQEISTPLTVRDLANYTKGEMYGLDHSPERFRQRWLSPQSSTKNLYFTGQDIITVGVSSALFSGLLTVSTVLSQNLSSLLKD